MNWLYTLLTQDSIPHTLLVLGVVVAGGMALGKLKVFGISLGVTWVLFVGLLAAYWGVNIPETTRAFLKDFGLVLFVYTLGLQVGPGFFASLNKHAALTNALAAGIVGLGVLLTLGWAWWGGYTPGVLGGIMSGAVTNTPGMAAAQTTLSNMHHTADAQQITLAYALTYPMGVFGIILAMLLLQWMFKIRLADEAERIQKLQFMRDNRVLSKHLEVTNPQLEGKTLLHLFEQLNTPIVVSRLWQVGRIVTPTPKTVLHLGDVLLIVAPKNTFERLLLLVGPESHMNLKAALDSPLQTQHVVVTNKDITHQRLADLPQLHQHDFTFTRLYRAGTQLVPNGNIRLQLGDTVKIVGTAEGLQYAAEQMGNSLKRLEVPDWAPLWVGIVLGVLVGSIPIQFPGIPIPVKIGLAGGPLIVALLMSRFGNQLYLNQYTTHSANLMVRELGICLFLACVGLSSGADLAGAFTGTQGLQWLGIGLSITLIPLVVVGWVARVWLKKSYFEIIGLLAGASTDPPALAFALKMGGNDIPSATYATVYPLTMILRIIAAQWLVMQW